jgi:hypothetical protein
MGQVCVEVALVKACSLTAMAYSSEMLVSSKKATRRHKPNDQKLKNIRCENLNIYVLYSVYHCGSLSLSNNIIIKISNPN